MEAYARPSLPLVGSEETRAIKLRDCRIADLVADNNVSVRLSNSIAQAEAANKLSLATIGDYLDAGSQAPGILMGEVRHFGRKSARELDELVIAECSGWHTRDNSTSGETIDDVEERRAELMSLIADEKLGDIARSDILSTRLANVLNQPEFAEILLTDALADYEKLVARLLRSPNCGCTSVKEFHVICTKHVGLRLAQVGLSGADFESALSILLSGTGRKEKPSVLLEMANAAKQQVHSLLEHATLAQRLDWLLAELDDRDREIIRRRSGIGQDSAETLEEIGACFGVTRERIRQIEAKSLRRIKKRIRGIPIQGLLDAEAHSQWTALSEGKPILLIGDLHGRRRAVCPYVSLALNITNVSLSDWLDRIACRFPLGWHVSAASFGAIEETAACLRSLIKTKPLPRAAASFEGCGSPETIQSACELIIGNPVHLGYVMPARVGARLGRLVGLHSILGEVGNPVMIDTLLLDYHARFPGDPCRVRDAEIVMKAAPHLFLEIEEGRWHALGIHGEAPGFAAAKSQALAPPTEDPGTIAHALQTTLKQRGPTCLGELLGDVEEILPEGRSINSIGPVLLTRPELFVRALPGVYALPEQISAEDELEAKDLEPLFNDNQARLYALARYAGEPRKIFPFWTVKSEYELCRWARHSGGAEIFGSLLSIADVEAWPLSASEREHWNHVKRWQGRFRLGSALRHASAYNRPDLDRVLAACFYAQSTGSLNWMAANRLTGRKTDSHGGAGLVALLVQLGVLEEPDSEGYRWQLSHRAKPAAKTVGQLLADELAKNGVLHWESRLGQEIAARAATAEQNRKWVDATAVTSMLGSSEQSDPKDEDDPLASLMNEHRRVCEADRREATLQWLLDD